MDATRAGTDVLTEGTIQTILADIQQGIADEERHRRLEAQQALETTKLAEREQRQKIRMRSARLAKITTFVVAVILPLIVFVVLAIFAPFHVVSALVFGILSAVALATGWSTWGLGRRLETWFGRRIYRFYCRLAFIALE